MTPEAKKRCEDHIEDAIEKWALGYDENTSFRVLGAELFQAGYNDPDAGKAAAKLILSKAREKIIERGEYKSTDFQLIDSLVTEFEAVAELERNQGLLDECEYVIIELLGAAMRFNVGQGPFEAPCIMGKELVRKLKAARGGG